MAIQDDDRDAQWFEDRAARIRAGIGAIRPGTTAHTIASKELRAAEELGAKHRARATARRATRPSVTNA